MERLVEFQAGEADSLIYSKNYEFNFDIHNLDLLDEGWLIILVYLQSWIDGQQR